MEHLSTMDIEKDETLDVPEEMYLVSLAGRAFVHGRPYKNTYLNTEKSFYPPDIAKHFGLSGQLLTRKVTMPAGKYGCQLNTGTIVVDKIYKYFRSLQRAVESWKTATVNRHVINVRAQNYLRFFQNEVITQLGKILRAEVFAGRAESSIVGKITNAPGIPYYCIALPENYATSVGIKEGDTVLTFRWPVLLATHVMKVVFWKHRTIGLPPTLFKIENADCDGDLQAVVKIPLSVVAHAPNPQEYCAKFAEFPNDYASLAFGETLDPTMAVPDRLTLNRMMTSGLSIGLENISGKKSIFDKLKEQSLGTDKYAPKGYEDKSCTIEEHIQACRLTAQQIGTMKAIIGPVGKTHRTLKAVLPECIPSITRVFGPIEQNGIDVGKQGTKVNWGPVSLFINKAQTEEGKFSGSAQQYAAILRTLIIENVATECDIKDLTIIAEGLYKFAVFPHYGGLNLIVEQYFPDLAFFHLQRGQGDFRKAAQLLIQGDQEPSYPSPFQVSGD